MPSSIAYHQSANFKPDFCRVSVFSVSGIMWIQNAISWEPFHVRLSFQYITFTKLRALNENMLFVHHYTNLNFVTLYSCQFHFEISL